MHSPVSSAQITDNVLLVQINKTYKQGMTNNQLYGVAKEAWKVGSRREKVDYIFAVNRGVVVAVYEVEDWYEINGTGKWGFTGKVASSSITKKYNGLSVKDYIYRNSIRYLNC